MIGWFGMHVCTQVCFYLEQGLRRGGLTLALVQHIPGNAGDACTVQTSYIRGRIVNAAAVLTTRRSGVGRNTGIRFG